MGFMLDLASNEHTEPKIDRIDWSQAKLALAETRSILCHREEKDVALIACH